MSASLKSCIGNERGKDSPPFTDTWRASPARLKINRAFNNPMHKTTNPRPNRTAWTGPSPSRILAKAAEQFPRIVIAHSLGLLQARSHLWPNLSEARLRHDAVRLE